MTAHDDILDPASPWRQDVRRNAAAKDAELEDEAAECGMTPAALVDLWLANAVVIHRSRTDVLRAEREQREDAE